MVSIEYGSMEGRSLPQDEAKVSSWRSRVFMLILIPWILDF